MQIVHQHLLLVKLARLGEALFHVAGRREIAADDLLLRRLAAGFVVDDGAADHVDAHVRRALVRAFAVDLAAVSYTHLSCPARKFLAAGHIASFQMHPGKISYLYNLYHVYGFVK